MHAVYLIWHVLLYNKIMSFINMLRKTFYLCPCLNNFCHVVPSSTPNDKVTPSFVEVYDIKFVFYDICLSEERLIFFSADTGKC